MENILDGVMSRKWLLILLMLFGVTLVFTGLFRGIRESSQVQVEYLNNDNELVTERIVIDVEGGVERPGVYEISSGSRMKDALVISGGLSPTANRELIAKMFNLASPLKDGQKIYVPVMGNSDTGVGYSEHENGSKLVNINSASEGELDTLEGIGETRAKTIIENRPYSNIEELVSKKAIPSSVFEKIKDSVIAY